MDKQRLKEIEVSVGKEIVVAGDTIYYEGTQKGAKVLIISKNNDRDLVYTLGRAYKEKIISRNETLLSWYRNLGMPSEEILR